MRPFPQSWKFKKFTGKQRQKKLLSIFNIIKCSTSIDNCLNNISNITKRDINTIEKRTRLQAKCDDWFHYKSGIITGTLSCAVSHATKRNEKREAINRAISNLSYTQMNYPAVKYGRDNEEMGIAAFMKKMKPKHHNLRVKGCGLRLDDTHHYIGASIDGYLECICCEPAILEIKCPYSIRDGSVAVDGRQLAYLTDELLLKKNHTYYYQMQTYLGVYKCKKGFFCVYTPQDVLVLEIDFDEEFWRNLKSDIQTYYYRYYLNDFFV